MGFQEIVSELDLNNHDNFIKNNLSIVNFFSEWKMDCLTALPLFEEIAEEFNGKVCFGKVNVDESEDLAKKHKISKVPSILFFKKGILVDRLDKFNSEELLRDKIMCLL